MYNLCHETTRQISAATYHRYQPKTVKLQGKIPFRQSCCECCQNFKNILNGASKYLKDIPSDVGNALDHSMCAYVGYFPKIDCILHICDKCGTSQYKDSILEKNASKVCDRSKYFLVKQWVTKTVCKEDGNAQSFLHWKFELCNCEELVNLLIKQMEVMTEHSFMASWNYVQYREARKNISLGQVIFVRDFAQNYLCEQLNEAQGLHWSHKQVTLMPTVAQYHCAKCEQLVTHEIVHISDDLKHDAHLVKLFTSKSIEVLKSNNVDIRKIIKFTDQAPSQYKNKTAFNYLANSKLPTQRNYFGTRHGKSSCDACTGRVKQGVSRLVKSEQAVVDDAQSFYDTCIQHLEKPLVQSDKCQHHILTFEMHKKIVKRPSTLQLVGIPDTRKLHQIGNTENFHAAAIDVYMAQNLVRMQFVLVNGQALIWQRRKLQRQI